MKQQLTIEHIIPYLSHGLKGIRVDGGKEIFKLTKISIDGVLIWSPVLFGDCIQDSISCRYIKPAFHTLSDLTKPIKVEGYNEGKEFVPINELAHWIYDRETDRFDNLESAKSWIEAMIRLEWGEIQNLPYKLIKKIISWHFAIGLPEGTWININTLNK